MIFVIGCEIQERSFILMNEEEKMFAGFCSKDLSENIEKLKGFCSPSVFRFKNMEQLRNSLVTGKAYRFSENIKGVCLQKHNRATRI